jgi:hypothetical protein
LLLCSLLLGACFIGTDPFVAPAPADRAGLESRVSRDSTDVSAVVALSVLGLAEAREEEVVALLEPAVERMPLDPVLPLLLGLARERAGLPLAAYDTYADYTEGHIGRLADLGGRRLEVVRVRARQEQADRLLADAVGGEAPNPRTIVVLPFSHSPSDARAGDFAAAVATLLAEDLRQYGWPVIDPQLARILLGGVTTDPEAYDDVSTGVTVGWLVGAGRVVQGTMGAPVADSVRWDVTLTTLTPAEAPEIAYQTVVGAANDLPNIERQLAVVLQDVLERSVQRDRFGPAHTQSSSALEAYGRGLLAMDRDDLGAARAAFEQAVELDSTFVEARDLAARAAILEAANAEPVEEIATTIARVGELQRSVLDLRSGPVSAHQQALTEVAARDRLLLTDVLGLDRLGGATLLELQFVLPGGGSP